MKRYLSVLLLLALLLTGCSQLGQTPATNEHGEIIQNPADAPTEEPTQPPTEPPVFDQGVSLWSVELAGMEAQQAYDTLLPKLQTYVLELVLNGRTLSLTAEDMGMALSLEAMENWCAGTTDGQDVITFSDDAIRGAISSQADVPAKNAGLEFQGKRYALTREEGGTAVDSGEAVETVKAAALELKAEAVAAGDIYDTVASIPKDSDAARAALEKANGYLELSLAYTFETLDGVQTYTLTRQDIARVLTFDENLSPVVDKDGARSIAAYLNFKYYIPGEAGWFVTHDGRTIETEVTYAAQLVDVDKLQEDIVYCVENQVSGTRPAAYRDATKRDLPFGGHYIEIDQNAQTVLLYKGGECILTTPTVTGNRAYGWYTPNGVFAINRKGEHVMLKGDTYNSYVRYWMCFRGGNYGLHDARWRDEFGGDIYLKNGSHGCVNLPPEAAEAMFGEIYVGTPVIIYHDPVIVGSTEPADPTAPTEG